MGASKKEPAGYSYERSLKTADRHLVNKIIQVERFIHRPLASLVVRAVFKTGITPNQISYASFLLGILAVYFFTRGTALFAALGGAFTLLSSIVDCADGQLARAKDLCSEYGAYLDIVFDRIVDFGLITGIALGVYRDRADVALLTAGLIAAGLYLLQISLFYLKKQYLRISRTGDTSEAHSLLLLAIAVFGFVNKLDIFLLLFLVQTVVVNAVRLVDFVRLGNRSRMG